MSTIYILWLRQIKRYLRSRARIIGSLGQPILFLIALGFGFGPIFKQAGGGNYMQFLTPGIIGMSILFTAIFSGIELIWDRQFGFLKETLVAPVSRTQIMIGRTLGGATVATLQGLIVLILSLFIGFHLEHFGILLLAIVIMFMIALMFTALGTAIASLLEDMQGFQLIMNFLVMPLFLLSGSLFPLQGLPKAINFVSKIDPLSYGIDALRGILAGNFHFGLGLDFLILFLLIIFFIAIGTFLFRRIQV